MFITKENIFLQPTKFSDLFIKANGYESLYMQIIQSGIEVVTWEDLEWMVLLII